MSFRSEMDKLIGRRADMLTRLIVINIIVFILANIFVNIPGLGIYVYDYFALPSSLHQLLYRPWTLITYMFLHVQTMHLIFNMLWFYWFGIIFTDFMGSKRLLYTYLLGGIGGGLLFIIFSNLFMPGANLVGASAGIMAVIVATAVLVPDYQLHLIFFGPVKLKYLAIGAFVLTSLVDFSVNSGGKVSHIGGALYGILYMYQYRKGVDYAEIAGNFVSRITSLLSAKNKGPKLKKSGGSGIRKQKTSENEKQKKIDAILDKISASGYEALTKEEKDFLFKSTKDS
jgi:membrane associated rhomboid family serine protease